MYVITGATGNIGRLITETLLSKGMAVRALSRSLERLNPLVDQGAEPFAGHLEDASFVREAFEGATAVYTMIPPILHTDDLRKHQNRIGENIAAAIQNAGIEYVVNLSSLGAHLSEGTGILLGSYDQEQRLNRIPGINVVHLRPAYFMENLLGSVQKIKREGILGSSLKGDISLPMVSVRDIAAIASRYLLELNFLGKVVHELLGQRNLTMNEITRILGAAVGKPDLRYIQISYQEAKSSMVRRGISHSVAEASVELSRRVNENPQIFDAQRTAENTAPTSIEDFAEVFAAIYGKGKS